MVKQYPKHSNEQLSDNFNSKEFDCHCTYPDCQVTYIDEELIKRLEEVRAELNTPLKVLSGFRCTRHNYEVRGKPGSQHLQGKAADITLPKPALEKLYQAFINKMDGVGKYPTFIHGDVRGYPARW